MTDNPIRRADAEDALDAIVIGAGISGLYQLHRLRELGLRVRVFEAGSGVGGTWFWNRYPGARFDSESYSYAYSFAPERIGDWRWKEHFSAQPENLAYLEFVADRLDLRRDIRFCARIQSARFDSDKRLWSVETEYGERACARFLITAVGVLSAPYKPDIEERDSFAGESWHTSSWPHERVDLRGKRVGVIGTGATAVQLITEVAKDVGHLAVFQRTANYCLPLGNRAITDEERADLDARREQIFARCAETFGAFIHDFDQRSVFDVDDAEREAIFESLYLQPGFAFWLGNFHDIMTDTRANEVVAEFVRGKIRARVHDPAVAEKLIPRDHAFGTKRVPLESGYFEVYNQPNVTLVDLRETPIERITPAGVKTSAAQYDLDVLVWATGFDAVTGALTRIDIEGEGGVKLARKWADGPRTYLGLGVAGFPNLFTVVGAHNAANFCNVPRCIEQNVDWVTDCIAFLHERGFTRIEASVEAEDAWRRHVDEVAAGTLFPHTDSWFMGANIPGKARNFLAYAGGLPSYRQRCEAVARAGYEGFRIG